MAWIVEDRRRKVEQAGGPYLTEELKRHLSERFLPRYPNKRAVLLPASMKLLGDWNWYLPSWLEWLPRLEAPVEKAERPERVEAPAALGPTT